MVLVLICILSYVLGSVPSGLILGRLLWQVDLREHGSCNIGATNAWRTIGRPAGLLIFACDFLKGAAGVWIGAWLVGSPAAMVLGGIFAVIGHSWSLFLKLQGGKGVATGLGVIAVLMPQVTALVFAVWFVIVRVSRYVSLGSIVAAACVPLAAVFWQQPGEYIFFSLLAAIFVIYRHKTNIGRLLEGTETKIKAKQRS